MIKLQKIQKNYELKYNIEIRINETGNLTPQSREHVWIYCKETSLITALHDTNTKEWCNVT